MIAFITLTLLSIIGAIVALVLKGKARDYSVVVASAIIAIASIVFFGIFCANGALTAHIYINFTSHAIDIICFVINIALMIVVLWMCAKFKKIIPAILALAQLGFEVYLEFGSAASTTSVQYGLVVDPLVLTMVLIIGVIGSAICIYGVGYMQDFQAHAPKEAGDKRSLFFALCIVFLGAMFLIVFSNNMMWMLCGWEITTVCSFLLIGYTRTEEAIKNSFLQITYNLIGGIAFAVAIWFSATYVETIEFSEFVTSGLADPALVAIPLVLFALSAFTKAAQMPFHTWLLGAMVAPTPTSALLHSSTMVKAGVFLLVKLAPLFAAAPMIGTIVALVGGLTFLFASLIAISQSNGKRVLAYSTIANLGLITMCAGIGSELAIWAAVLLIIFHAIAKSLLFLCVGTAEHHVGSRDIESFDLLFDRMPKLARFMMFGILVMFIAPFGMLIGKWGALTALADAKNITLLIFMAFGSAATFMYWAKWLGKLSGITSASENIEGSVTKTENFSLYLIATLLALVNICLPLISETIGSNVAAVLFNTPVYSQDLISLDLLCYTALIAVLMFVVLFVGVGRKQSENERQLKPYMAGVTANSAAREFRGALGEDVEATSRNLYLEKYFGESSTGVIQIFAIVLIAVAFYFAIMMFLG